MAKDKILTWQQKLDAGETLNELEETKADADFNFTQRLKENKERAAFEARKQVGRPVAPSPTPVSAPNVKDNK